MRSPLKFLIVAASFLFVGLGPGPSSAADYEDLRVPGTTMGSGSAGGSEDASSLYGDACKGNIDETPDHTLKVVEPGLVTVEVSASVDTTLVLVGPGGTLCDDDSGEGENPRLSQYLPAGDYRVFIGAYDNSDSLGRYTIIATGVAEAAGTVDTGQHGALSAPGSFRATGQAGGPRDASQVYGSDCVGQIDSSPDHALHVTEQATVNLRVQAESGDTTLVLVCPGAVYCNDDTSNDDRNPSLSVSLAASECSVFVGSYSRGDQHVNYVITAGP